MCCLRSCWPDLLANPRHQVALRSHLSMPAYSWTTSATTNDWINAGPVLEMRTALDQALGAPANGYAAGLAQNQPVLAVHIQELRDRVLAAWQNGSSVDLRWLVSDQLGTARMIFDQSGSFANMNRHDYLPFGEELSAGIGLEPPRNVMWPTMCGRSSLSRNVTRKRTLITALGNYSQSCVFPLTHSRGSTRSARDLARHATCPRRRKPEMANQAAG